MLETWADTVSRQLNAAHDGRWYVWYVRGPYSPTTWHARPAGSDVCTIRAESPEELVKAIGFADRGEEPSDDTGNVVKLADRKQ